MIGHAKPSYLPNPYGALRMVAYYVAFTLVA